MWRTVPIRVDGTGPSFWVPHNNNDGVLDHGDAGRDIEETPTPSKLVGVNPIHLNMKRGVLLVVDVCRVENNISANRFVLLC